MEFISEREIRENISMEDVIGVVEKAFLAYAHGKVVYPPKTQFLIPGNEWRWWGFMPAYVDGMGLSCKIVSDYPENKSRGKQTITATLILCDESDGHVKAIMDANYLTALRTGALCAIAARLLSREDSTTVGIIGCGTQARTQLEGLSLVRPLSHVLIYDPKEEAMDKFIADMSHLGLPIEKSTKYGVLDADIIIAATVSKTPVVFGDKLRPGAHITSIGAHTPDSRELDDDVINKAKVVIDSKDALKSGDLKNYKGGITEIKDVISGKRVRTNKNDITLFKSVGTAIQDVAIASLVYKRRIKN